MESEDTLVLLAARRQNDDRDGREPTQATADIEAVHAWQHQVEDDEVGRGPMLVVDG
jgi:outer membrane receptor for ferrienterochelin and colicin